MKNAVLRVLCHVKLVKLMHLLSMRAENLMKEVDRKKEPTLKQILSAKTCKLAMSLTVAEVFPALL